VQRVVLYDNRIASSYVISIIIKYIKYKIYVYIHMYLEYIEKCIQVC
jgi:hypothetical protein